MAKLMIGLLQADTGGATYQALVNSDRLALVKDAVEKLAVRAKGVDFGIFAAPEYLFSNENSKQPIGLAGSGKYYARGITEQQKEDNVEALRKLSDLHKKLILIPGTMAWLKPFDREKGIAKHKSDQKALRHPGERLRDRTFKARKAVLGAASDAEGQGYKKTTGYRGGKDYGGREVPKTTDKIAQIKEHELKDIKILRNSLYVIWNNQVLHKYNKVADYHEVLDMESQPSVFVPGDMARQTKKLFDKNFGFEICLDHAYNMLGFHQPKRLTDVLDIHVVLSASVDYDDTDLSEGGLFIHASSDKAETGVWMIKGSSLLTIAEDKAKRDEMGNGCRMRYFETEMAIDLK